MGRAGALNPATTTTTPNTDEHHHHDNDTARADRGG